MSCRNCHRDVDELTHTNVECIANLRADVERMRPVTDEVLRQTDRSNCPLCRVGDHDSDGTEQHEDECPVPALTAIAAGLVATADQSPLADSEAPPMPQEFAMAALIDAFRSEHREVVVFGELVRNEAGGWTMSGWHTSGGNAGINEELWSEYWQAAELRWKDLHRRLLAEAIVAVGLRFCEATTERDSKRSELIGLEVSSGSASWNARRELVQAPWTADQVLSLNAYQQAGYVHEYTGIGGGRLIATETGWVGCSGGAVLQTWAHRFSTDWSWKDANLDALLESRKP